MFLAADKVRLQDLDEAVRRLLAWKSILAEKDALNLDPHQVRQAETQKQAADDAVTARLPETFQWLLTPEQADPQAAITWQAVRLAGAEALAVRASSRLEATNRSCCHLALPFSEATSTAYRSGVATMWP